MDVSWAVGMAVEELEDFASGAYRDTISMRVGPNGAEEDIPS